MCTFASGSLEPRLLNNAINTKNSSADLYVLPRKHLIWFSFCAYWKRHYDHLYDYFWEKDKLQIDKPASFLSFYLENSGFVCLFCCFTSQVNSYGHGGTVSSPNHFFLGKLVQAVNQYFVHILSFVTDNNPS